MITDQIGIQVIPVWLAETSENEQFPDVLGATADTITMSFQLQVDAAEIAFGAVRYARQHALNPVAWSIPCVISLAIIIWHAGKREYFARFGWKRV